MKQTPFDLVAYAKARDAAAMWVVTARMTRDNPGRLKVERKGPRGGGPNPFRWLANSPSPFRWGR